MAADQNPETIISIKDLKSVIEYKEISRDFGSKNRDYIVERETEGYEITTTKQKIRFMIVSEQDCCEICGFFMSNDNFSDFIGAKILSIYKTDIGMNTIKIESATNIDCDEYDNERTTETIFVNIETDKGILQFTAYNNHNGYYGRMVKVESLQLNYQEKI